MTLSNIPKITLEQWAALRSVVDEGSFAKAAEALNKSQSTISYAIARLNDLLPSPALIQQGRRTVLTDLGTIMYRHACQLLDQALATEQAATFLGQGWESQLTLAADALTPMNVLFSALQGFSSTCTITRIKILETSLSGTDEALFSRQCDLVLTPHVPPGFLGDEITTVSMIPVAHTQHPLAHYPSIDEMQLRAHRQIVVRDSGSKREQNVGWLGSEQRWTVSHFSSSVEAVRAGLGFAFLPKHRIESLLNTGELIHLPLVAGAYRKLPLYLIIAQPQKAGPAAKALKAQIKQTFALNNGEKNPKKSPTD